VLVVVRGVLLISEDSLSEEGRYNPLKDNLSKDTDFKQFHANSGERGIFSC
jgi:hypothetical protein